MADEIARSNPSCWLQKDRDVKADMARFLFGIGLVKSDTCTSCHLSTNRTEANKLTHLINIMKGSSLQQMLDASMKSQLEGFTCSGCGRDAAHAQKYLVKDSPEILMIQPNRWLGGADFDKKNERHIYFTRDEMLDITPHLSGQIHGDVRYRLNGVILHFGTPASGHYISLVRDHIGRWRMYDDTTVRDIDVAQWGEREVREGFTGSLYAFVRVATAPRAARQAARAGSIAQSVHFLPTTPPRTPTRSRSTSVSTSSSRSPSITTSSSSPSASSSDQSDSSSIPPSSKSSAHELVTEFHGFNQIDVPMSISSGSPSPNSKKGRRRDEGNGSDLVPCLRMELEIAREQSAKGLAIAQLTWEEARLNDADHQKWAYMARFQNEKLKEAVKNLKQKLSTAEAKLTTATTGKKVQTELRQVRVQLSSLQAEHAYLDEHNQRLHMIAAGFVVKKRQHDVVCAQRSQELARRVREVAELRKCCQNQAINLKEQEIILHRQMEAQFRCQTKTQVQGSSRKYPTSAMKENTDRLKEQTAMLSRQVIAGEDEIMALKARKCTCHVVREALTTQQNTDQHESRTSKADEFGVKAAESSMVEKNTAAGPAAGRDQVSRLGRSSKVTDTPKRRSKTLRRNGSLPQGMFITKVAPSQRP